MTPRSVVVLLLLAATANASAEDSTKPLAGRALARFLGPVSSNLVEWQRNINVDAEDYWGTAKPPVSGTVGIDILLGTWHPDLGVMPDVGGPDQLGTLRGTWSKGRDNDGYYAAFRFADADQRQVYVRIHSPLESDVDTLRREISRLPMFNSTPSTPFHGIIMRKQSARVVVWLILPILFVIGMWLPDRHLSKIGVSGLRRALTFGATAVAWISLFIGLVIIIQRGGLPEQGFWILRVEPGWFLVPAMALVSFVAAALIVLWLLVRRFLRSKFART